MSEVRSKAKDTYLLPLTVMLSFVSFWRASAIVLCDLGSSAYYVGGIAEKAIGKAAPWFILGVMLFSYAVRGIYIESCSMFVRGGVYRVVREAMGGTAAKFSVAALMFDYVLTGPISGVSAGLYCAALINELGSFFHQPAIHVQAEWFAALFAAAVVLYFWYTNRIGIPFSSTRALRIMQATTVMVVLLIGWAVYTIAVHGYHPVPLPAPRNIHFDPSALGWLKGTALPNITLVVVMIGLGHSVLALSGEETLAEVNRELAAPKQNNLERTGVIIFVYSMLFTSLVSFLAVMLIPDDVRPKYFDNLIGGLSMFLAGPLALRLSFHIFVVIIGVLILSGAVNTAIIGSVGVLSRVTEDGVLPPWFRLPHPKYGTSYRLVTTIVVLQLLTIAISRGNVNALGEAYAFGVVWSFAMKGLAVIVLRFTYPDTPRWRFPLNFRLGRYEIPVGLVTTTGILFALASINLFTKKTATISGVVFTVVFFVAFTLSERKFAPKEAGEQIKTHPDPSDPFRETAKEYFRCEQLEVLTSERAQIKPGGTIVHLEKPDDLRALQGALSAPESAAQDIMVVHIKSSSAGNGASVPTKAELEAEEVDVFSEAVFSAEKVGRPIRLLAIRGEDASESLLRAADRLQASTVWVASSESTATEQKRQQLGELWKELNSTQQRATLEFCIVGDDDGSKPRSLRLTR